jgi:hypothetical protein
VAGWFAALGGGARCGELLSSDPREVSVRALAGGGHHLAYGFAGHGQLATCELDLTRAGGVEHLEVVALPRAQR